VGEDDVTSPRSAEEPSNERYGSDRRSMRERYQVMTVAERSAPTSGACALAKIEKPAPHSSRRG